MKQKNQTNNQNWTTDQVYMRQYFYLILKVFLVHNNQQFQNNIAKYYNMLHNVIILFVDLQNNHLHVLINIKLIKTSNKFLSYYN